MDRHLFCPASKLTCGNSTSTPLVVIINEADALSRDAQAALRRTMEKYSTNIRIIMCANSTSKIISPIRSRCLLVRVAAPEEDEVSPGRPSRGDTDRDSDPD